MKRLFTLIAFHVFFTVSAQRILDDIKSGNIEKVEKWLKKSKQVTETYKKSDQSNSYTVDVNVIEWAAYHDQYDIVELFVANKAKFPNFSEWINRSLGATIHNCNMSLFQLLVDQGARLDFNCVICKNSPPIAIALSYECKEIYTFLKSQSVPMITNGAGFDVIHAAAAVASVDQLKDLVEKDGLDINQKGKDGFTPILSAVNNGKIENIAYLTSKGASLTDKDASGLTAFHYAKDLPTFLYIEEKLIKTGLMTMEMVDKGSPLLMSIIESDNKELFDYVIDHYKALLKSKDSDRRNVAFSLLASTENTDYFFEQLKKNKVSFTHKDKYGKDLKFYAKKMKKDELLDLLSN